MRGPFSIICGDSLYSGREKSGQDLCFSLEADVKATLKGDSFKDFFGGRTLKFEIWGSNLRFASIIE